jgi:hypothetical protein
VQGSVQGWQWRWKAPSMATQVALAAIILVWLLWRLRGRWRLAPDGPGRIRALRPLLSSAGRIAPVEAGDTARAWLLRLGSLRPERMEALHRLADTVDAESYGPGGTASATLAKVEAAAWRGWRPTSR